MKPTIAVHKFSSCDGCQRGHRLRRGRRVHPPGRRTARLLALPDSDPAQPAPEPPLPAGTGFGCSEAPRGILWQHYQTDAAGLISTARIVPPTSQNQARIEQDLRRSLQAFGLNRDSDSLRLHAETVIRNYDPCISCATHFLTLNLVSGAPPTTTRSSSRLLLVGIGSALGADSLAPELVSMLQQEAALRPYLVTGRLQLLASLQPLRDGLQADTEVRLIILDMLLDNTGDQPRHLRLDNTTRPLGWSSHGLSLPELNTLLPLLDIPREIEILALPQAPTRPGSDKPVAEHDTLIWLRDWLLTQLA